MNIAELIAIISSWIWGWPFIGFCLATGLYFSLRTRFLQMRYLKSMLTLLFQRKSSGSGISPFQAFMLALSGRVGTGNIAGVATAIALGGPGAVFWMWIIAFFGAGTAYIEASLGQIYKERIDGNYRGGPAYYISKGLGIKWYAAVFAVIAIISLGIFMPGVQANAICSAFDTAFAMDKRLTAGIIIFLLSLIIFGGVKRIAKVAEIVTPFMAVGYILVALVILVLNYHRIPAMFMLIIKSALGIHPALSGVIGAAISMGVKRGIFSNEAGQGTAPHAAAAAEVSHPVEQGLVQAFSVYIDTLLICSATAFIILITGMYRVYDSAVAVNVVVDGTGLPNGINEYGPIYTQLAIDAYIPGFGSAFVALALFFFAFTTIISYYFQAETNVYFLFRKNKTNFYAVNTLRLGMLCVTFFTAINTMTLAWDMADIGVGMMAWFNLIAILFLRKVAFKVLNDYENQLKTGVEKPSFLPEKLNIKNAEEWNKIKVNF
ncbi:MAG: alanine:cation symporter family protein [Dysgonamonadaceae bacterium]|jgi:AGCS family alanine or glycine:cation symporter|nr:alanine:cation symporter family protein [Dysgonamonadaceae bacterium]